MKLKVEWTTDPAALRSPGAQLGMPTSVSCSELSELPH